MKSDDLLDLIGEAPDEHIREAKAVRRHFPRWAKWTSAAAACLCLALILTLFPGTKPGGKGGSGDKNGDLVYMHYAGPVLPMTVQGSADGITAQRDVQFDFTPYISMTTPYEDGSGTYSHWSQESTVTDRYVLTNETGGDLTLELLYPHIGNLREWVSAPVLSVDGAPVQPEVHPGPYSGGFTGVWGSDDPDGTVNLQPLSSFPDYERLLATDDYLQSALDDFPDLDLPVAVYRLHDFQYTADKKAENPTLQIRFGMDFDRTQVFTYGFNGCTFDADAGYCAFRKGAIEIRPNASEACRYPEDGWLIVLGDDLQEYTLQGYRNGGCDRGDGLPDLSCTVTRTESTLNDMIALLMDAFIGESANIEGPQAPITREMLCGLAAELLTDWGLLSDAPVERYDSGMLGDLFSEVFSNDRITYLSFPVTVPAGESVTVEAVMQKDASFDYAGEGRNQHGYELATRLGSALRFERQSASVIGLDEVEIVDQNFGFDPEAGITEVELDLSQPHYWMKIMKRAPEN